MERANAPRYIAVYFAAIVCFALGGVFVKYSSLGSCAVAFYRMLLSVIVLLPLVAKELRRIKRRDFLLLVGGGLLLGANLAMWNYALVNTTQANANLLANMHIFATVPLSFFLYKEKIRKPYVVGVIVAFAGLIVLVLGKAAPQAGNFTGDILAFVSSLFYGCYMMVTYAVRDRVSAWTAIFCGGLGCVLVLFPLMWTLEGLQFPTTWAELWPIALITITGQFGGIGLMSLALGRIRATLASVLSLTQPVVGALFGLILFGEILSGQEIAGILVVSLGVYIAQKKDFGKKRLTANTEESFATEENLAKEVI